MMTMKKMLISNNDDNVYDNNDDDDNHNDNDDDDGGEDDDDNADDVYKKKITICNAELGSKKKIISFLWFCTHSASVLFRIFRWQCFERIHISWNRQHSTKIMFNTILEYFIFLKCLC